MAADVIVQRPSLGPDIKVMNQKMTIQHTVRSTKLDERQLFKLVKNLDSQKNRRILQIDKEVSDMTKDLEKLLADQEAAKQQRLARRAQQGADDPDAMGRSLNSAFMRRRSILRTRRATQFDAFAFRLKREAGAIKSPVKKGKYSELFRFDSRGNPVQDLSPVDSHRKSRELDCSEEDIAMMAWQEMKNFAANIPNDSTEPGLPTEENSRVPSRAATSAIESVSIHSAQSLDDDDDDDNESIDQPVAPKVQEKSNVSKSNSDWAMILNAVVDGKLLAALKKEIDNPTAPSAPAKTTNVTPAKKKNVFIKSKWARIATAARNQDRKDKEDASQAGAKSAIKNPFLKQVLSLKKPATAPAAPVKKIPLRRKYINRNELATNVLLGVPRTKSESDIEPPVSTPNIKKEVSFIEPETPDEDDNVFITDDDDPSPITKTCGVPDCICHCGSFRASASGKLIGMDSSVDDYYDARSRSYAASTGQPIISPIFRTPSSTDWSGVGRRAALPPPSPTPSEILEGVNCTPDAERFKLDYFDLDTISSIRRPIKGSNRERLLKEKEANARTTFQLMREKMAEKHPHDFNRNYGTPTPNWKILNPLKLRHKINQSSPLYSTWNI